MQLIYTTCDSGHRLKGKPTLAGKTIRCPNCGKPAVFPAAEKQAISDTGVMQILGLAEQTPDPPGPGKMVTYRVCPKCRQQVVTTLRVCNHCNCYLGVVPRIWNQIFPSADKTPPSRKQSL